jgi:hypothetical protein
MGLFFLRTASLELLKSVNKDQTVIDDHQQIILGWMLFL